MKPRPSDRDESRRGVPSDQRASSLGLALAALLTLIVVVLYWQGVQGTDDVEYARLAARWNREGPGFEDVSHKRGRLACIMSLALSFRVLGTGPAALALVPLLCTVATAPLLGALAGRSFGPRVGVATAFLFALFPVTARYGTFFVPEPILGLLACGSAWLAARALDGDGGGSRLLLFAAGVVAALGWLTTEAGMLLPLVLIAVAAAQGSLSRRHVWLVAGSAAVVLAEMLYWTAVRGQPLFRLTGLGGGYLDDPMVLSANRPLRWRLCFAYPEMLLIPTVDFALFGVPFAVAALAALRRPRLGAPFLIWSAAILLFYNFMSARFDHYVALPLSTRLIVPGLVPLLPLLAALLVGWWDGGRTKSHVIGAVGRGRRIAVGGAAVLLAASSLFALSLEFGTSFVALVARNATLAARHIATEARVTLVTDQRTWEIISFERGYREGDSWVKLEEPEPVAPPPAVAGAKILVLNGPVVFEYGVSGGIYGPPLSLPEEVRSLAQRRWNAVAATAWDGGESRSTWWSRLAASRVLRPFVGSRARILESLASPADLPKTRVRVLRLAG